MKNSKTAWDIFKKILIILFIMFLINYFIANSSYYEKRNSAKATITEEKAREFENDIKEGKNIDIKDYIEEENEDTSNIISNLGYNTSEFINDIVTQKLFKVFKVVGKLFK